MGAPEPKTGSCSQFDRLVVALSMSYGFPIFPCNPLTKAPMIGGRGGFKSATSKFDQLRQWADQYPNAMAGLPTGHQTGFWVLDVDRKADRNGFASLAELERRHGKLPETFHVRTGTGGHHIYFRMPAGVRIPQRAGDIAPGLDVRGSTGYVIAPGSVLSDGREYREIDGRGFDDIAAAPDWLLFMAVFGKRRREDLEKIGIRGPDDLGCEPWQWADRVREMLRPERPRLQGTLTESGADEIRRYVGKGIAAEIEAIRGLEEGGRDTGINNAAIKIWSLLNGAEELGVDVNDIAEKAGADFDEACSSLGDEFSSHEFVDDKWTRAQADADPRDIGYVPRGRAEDEFGDVSTAIASTTTDRLLFPRDISWDRISQIHANALVSGILLPGETGTIYGTHSTGKTFVALDLAFSIAQGREWHGRSVKQAPVLYVSLEGVTGFDKRTLAAIKGFGDPGTCFARMVSRVLLNKSDAGKKGAQEVIAACRDLERINGRPVGLVIIDTKARATAGDNENDNADQAVYQELRTGLIARETGAAVLTVHHESKAGSYRGGSAAPAGDDVILHVERLSNGRRVTAEKVKDGEDGIALFDFELQSVDLGADENGEIVTSCIVSKSEPKRQTTETVRKAERVLREAFATMEASGNIEVGELPGTATPGCRADLDMARDVFIGAYAGATPSERDVETASRAWRSIVRKLPSDFAATLDSIWRSTCPLERME